MTPNGTKTGSDGSRFRRTLVRVLVVQAIALAILGAIQAVYNVGP